MRESLRLFYDELNRHREENPAAHKSLCEKSVRMFALTYFQHYLQFSLSEFHTWLNETFDRETQRKQGCKWAIAAPRGNAKSTWITLIFPLWCVLFGKKKFIIIISDTADQAQSFLDDIKSELFSNKKIMEDFPECCKKTDRWRLDEVITSNDVRITALGSKSKILGRRHKANRPDLIVLDDLENQDDVISVLMRTRLWEWFSKEVLKAGSIDGTTDFYVIGTIKHQDSLLSNLLDPKKNPGWQGKKFQAVISFADNVELWEQWRDIYSNKDNENRFEDAEKFYLENEEEMLRGSEVLWEEGEPYIRLMEVKQEGDVSFYSEKMNEPVDRTKCLIDFEELRFYDDRDLEGRSLVIYGALDPATGKGRSTDYSCITTAGKCRKSGKVFILDTWFSKLSIEKQIHMIIQKNQRFNYQKFFIETNAFQIVIHDHVQKLARLTQQHVPVEGVTHGGNQKKDLRIDWMIPFLKDGTVFFHPSMKLMIEQVCNYIPGGGSLNDDGPDCLSILLKEMLKKRFRMIAR